MTCCIVDYNDDEITIIREDIYKYFRLLKDNTFLIKTTNNIGFRYVTSSNIKEIKNIKEIDCFPFIQVLELNNEIVYIYDIDVLLNGELYDITIDKTVFYNEVLKQNKRFSQVQYKFKIYNLHSKLYYKPINHTYKEEYQGSFLDVIKYLYDD